MFFKKSKSKTTSKVISSSIKDVESNLKENLQNSCDIVFKYFPQFDNKLAIMYVSELTDASTLSQNLITPIQSFKKNELSIEKLAERIMVGEVQVTDNYKDILSAITKGWAYVHLNGHKKGIIVNISQRKERSIAKPENETNVYGSQIAFTESLPTNKALIRQYINNPMLTLEELEVGKVTRTKVAICYIKGVANNKNVNTMRQRIDELEFDGITDSATLAQLIEDNSMSLFPQMLLTERPDRLASEILEGKIAVLADGSSYAIISPSNILNFFQSTEDHYVRWNMALFIRLVRLVAIIISVLLTPSYVAALTFHYEVIPTDLLVQLGQTRSRVPFPPLLEALFLEFTIELLREAGARLPTKVGQTIGIVGGIVISQAAVQAGFTSNILIIIVALSALGSFTTPIFMMGNAIRIIRFPLIVLAGTFGGLGIGAGISFLIIHLLRLTSLGSPYLAPFYPIRVEDFKDSIIRLPYSLFNQRPLYTHAQDKGRFNKERANAQKTNKHKDIDE